MATHNRLCALGSGEYLEVIAVDPDATAPAIPARPRWFDLDRRIGPPRLSNWIARTDDLDAIIARYPEAGRATDFARGDYRWRMAVPDDGVLPFDGCFPALIEWRTASPAFADVGLRLLSLTLCHPDGATLAAVIAALTDDPRIRTEIGPVGMEAQIDTPHGPRRLA